MDKLICTKCLIQKNEIEFSKQKSTKRGFSYWCKKCSNSHQKEYRKRPEVVESKKEYWIKYKSENIENIKKARKRYNEVNKNILREKRTKKRKENLDEIRKKERDVYNANKEHITSLARANRAKNVELYRETNKRWYVKNRERIRELDNAYRNSRRDFFNAYKREYRKRNPEIYKRKDAERIAKITDGYIRNCLSEQLKIPAKERYLITKEMIEIKRLQIKIYRELKKIKEYDKSTA